MASTPFTTNLKTLGSTRNIFITPPSFMKFCPVVPEICSGQVHGARKERRRTIIIRNRTKTISLQTLFGRLNYSLHLTVFRYQKTICSVHNDWILDIQRKCHFQQYLSCILTVGLIDPRNSKCFLGMTLDRK